ncbi:cyclin-dependent kinase inhibitor-related protein [Anaeramoeba flamelloides]|uniref:Cyclin-dependent kinase inhibitor-related protein n=1 Tax=Anaeramoeba flamelloides TaxID=1746091 RepID=A0ABQ8YCY5_9EUKA|nr:cyclin-dependent kinase inhibitor-related protein [Anaeramoeba flamelloides]
MEKKRNNKKDQQQDQEFRSLKRPYPEPHQPKSTNKKKRTNPNQKQSFSNKQKQKQMSIQTKIQKKEKNKQENKTDQSTQKQIQYFFPSVIISGGQTGADSIPFKIFRLLKKKGVKIKGWMPKGFKRLDGKGSKIAQKYGLREGKGGYHCRNKKNVEECDAIIGFLTSKPRTGSGTTKTFNYTVHGKYAFEQMYKPRLVDWVVVNDLKPGIIFWDITNQKIQQMSEKLQQFFDEFRPNKLLVSGSVEKTYPGITNLGALLFKMTLKNQGNRRKNLKN